MIVKINIGHLCQQILQIFIGIQFIDPGIFDHGIQNCIGLGSFERVSKQPCTASCSERAYACFAEVVADGEVSIFQKRFQILFLVGWHNSVLPSVFHLWYASVMSFPPTSKKQLLAFLPASFALDPGLIHVQVPTFHLNLVDAVIDRLQPLFTAADGPVGHVAAGKDKAQTVPVFLLPVKRHTHHKLLVHDLRGKGWGCQ